MFIKINNLQSNKLVSNKLIEKKDSHRIYFAVGLLFTAAALPLVLHATSGNVQAVSVPGALLTEQQAISTVFNTIEQQGNRIVVNNRFHGVTFDQNGVQFSPTRGPDWHWQISADARQPRQSETATNHANKSHTSKFTAVKPVINNHAIDYVHKDYTERYLLKARGIEQRFIIEQPYTAKQDLVIEGKINSSGTFEASDNGWVWYNKAGVVSLGQVTVFDADGKILPASMQTDADYSRITVAASELKTARYPVTIDPEIGSNDIRLSDMGPDGDTNFAAYDPAVAYNAANMEYYHGNRRYFNY